MAAHDVGLVGLGMVLMLGWTEMIAWLARRRQRRKRVRLQPVAVKVLLK